MPDKWSGKVEGLCGNYNLKASDEFHFNNIVGSTAQEFGNYYKATEPCTSLPDPGKHPCEVRLGQQLIWQVVSISETVILIADVSVKSLQLFRRAESTPSNVKDIFTALNEVPVYFVALLPIFSSFVCVYSQFWSGSWSNV